MALFCLDVCVIDSLWFDDDSDNGDIDVDDAGDDVAMDELFIEWFALTLWFHQQKHKHKISTICEMYYVVK